MDEKKNEVSVSHWISLPCVTLTTELFIGGLNRW